MLEQLFGYVMRGCYWLTGNYVISLLLFSLAFQLVLFPLGWKQQKNMVKQAMLRPQEMAIKKKYAGRNDQATMRKMQNELLELQQKNGYSPLAGCLPMLVQMIIIFPLYWVVIRPLQYCGGLSYSACYKLAELFNPANNQTSNEAWGWAWKEMGKNGVQPTSNTFQVDIARHLAENKDRLSEIIPSNLTYVDNGVSHNVLAEVQEMVSGVGIPNAGVLGDKPFAAFSWLVIIPLLNLGLMYLSQFISKKLNYQSVQQETQQNSSMKIMMIFLPLMSLVATAAFPAAIGIYWIFRTILSMLQQFILYKALPYPKFTEEDYKKAEKEFKKGITAPAGSRNIPQREYRSLHHIDDDE